jgi:hypothetical protein
VNWTLTVIVLLNVANLIAGVLQMIYLRRAKRESEEVLAEHEAWMARMRQYVAAPLPSRPSSF